jgi:hypothetical protein
VLCTAPSGLCRFLLPIRLARCSVALAQGNPEHVEGLRGPAPRGYNGDGKCMVSTASSSGGGHVRVAKGRFHSPYTGLSFADKH